MGVVTALEAKNRLGQLLDRVARGEEVVITRHEKPIARLIPEGQRDLKSVRRAAAGLRELQRKLKKRAAGSAELSLSDVKSAVAEGRR